MPDPYQIFYDEEAKFSQPQDQQPYPTPATDLAISRATKLKAAEQAYYSAKNSQPGFVSHNDPGAMDEGTFQGLLQALKPQPLGSKLDMSNWPPGEIMQKELSDERFKNRELQQQAGQQVEDKWNQIRSEMEARREGDRKGNYKTITMTIGDEEWEVPANPEDVGMTEEQFAALGDDPSKWPPDVLDTLEKLARDKLEMGYDPFGNPMDDELDEDGNPQGP